jgi:6-phosphogluconolactonase
MNTDKTYISYIGTYTKGNSKGIYTFKLNVDAAIISDIKEVAQLENPTYLNISKNNHYLYDVNKEGLGWRGFCLLN